MNTKQQRNLPFAASALGTIHDAQRCWYQDHPSAIKTSGNFLNGNSSTGRVDGESSALTAMF
jgi:hypothetical protein